MKRGFYTIMAAQFFSSLADNALFVTAVALLRTSDAPAWQEAALVPMFALFYVVFAPFVGAVADAWPKGQVMFMSNAVKALGCLSMLFGSHPLLSYALVGLGAATYSPAKYGILTELLPTSQLVKANGWIEGLTITSIILGVLLGGQLIDERVSAVLLAFDMPLIDTGISSAPDAAISVLVLVYLVAAWFNTRIPRTDAPLNRIPHDKWRMLPDFWRCNARLWHDKLGQISLATTTLFWGVSGNLRYIVLAWAAIALSLDTSQASRLVGVVAVGTAAGAVLASVYMRLEHAVKVIALGVTMGVLIIVMNWITRIDVAVPFLILLGGLGGFLVVPMNALLQHRGANLMGSGHSIAVQNFNEQACILGLGALYTLCTKWGLSAFNAIALLGVLVTAVMIFIGYWHRRNCEQYPQEVAHLFEIARNDNLHG